jgi:hypothetical protein
MKMKTFESTLKEHGFLCIEKKLKNYGGEYLHIFSSSDARTHPRKVEILCEYLKKDGWVVFYKRTGYYQDGHTIDAFKWNREPVLDLHGEFREHIYIPKCFKRTCTYTSENMGAEYAAKMNIESFMELQEIKFALGKEGIKIQPRFLEEVNRIVFMINVPRVDC